MESAEHDIRKDWTLIEHAAGEIWPEGWNQLNPLEIKALEEIIENGKSLNTEIAEVPGGMGCDFSADLQNIYYLLAILWYLQNLSGVKTEDIRRKTKSFIETCDQEMQDIYKRIIEPRIDYLISLLKKKR